MPAACVPRADVRDVRLALDEDLGAAKVAKLQHVCLGVDQQILRLDVAMAHAKRVNISKRAAELVRVKLHVQRGELLLGLRILARDAVNGPRDEIHHEVEVRLIGLAHRQIVGVSRLVRAEGMGAR